MPFLLQRIKAMAEKLFCDHREICGTRQHSPFLVNADALVCSCL